MNSYGSNSGSVRPVVLALGRSVSRVPRRFPAACVCGLILLAAGPAAAAAPPSPLAAGPPVAIAQPLAIASPTGAAPAGLPPPIADSLRRLPPPDTTWEVTAGYGSPAPPASDFPGATAPAFYETFTDAEPGAAPEAAAPPPVFEPMPQYYLSDENSDLIQIAPDPADPWSSDPFGRYSYRGSGSPPGPSNWMPGNGDRMGMLTFVFNLIGEPEEGKFTAGVAAEWHLVSGPRQTDMPPHLWDFMAQFGRRDRLDSYWSYDVAVRPGWFSDFEGSARDGFRIPAHGVVYYTPADTLQLLAGIDYLDRDDIALLPVAGAVLKPHPDFRLDAVFPRPRIAVRAGEGQRWVYLGAEMGGGMWAIERADLRGDVVSYRDYRLNLGVQLDGPKAEFFEVSYVFARHLEYRSGTPSYDPLETTLLRFVNCY